MGHPEWEPSILPESPVWLEIDRINTVSAVEDDWRPGEVLRETLVIPFLEKNIRTAPIDCWGLIPSSIALETFADKACFASFAQLEGLGKLVPRTYWPGQYADFPVVLKRTNLAAGQGMAVVHGPEDLKRLLGDPTFAGKSVTIQEHVASLFDFVTHCICSNGYIVEQCTFEYRQLDAMIIPSPAPEFRTRSVDLPKEDLRDLERFLRPMRYDGPCNFNYRRRGDGRLAVLEINPRFGGSLFRAPHREYLRRQLQALIDYAVWRAN